MTYEHLKSVFERTGTIPIRGLYALDYPRVCLNAALTIEKRGLTAKYFKNDYKGGIYDNEFSSFENGWEGYSIEPYDNPEEYKMGKRLAKELKPDLI